MRFTKNLVPDEVLKRIETLSAAIAEGKIVVPKTPEELHHFALPPGL
jgi:basic membrane lipoprotein Med (substrate-binding protein (PBP1-ABC) superfamily)